MFTQRLNKAAYVVLACFFLWPSLVVAAPTGGVVTNGDASINQSGTVTDINQASQKATINWQGFLVAPNETVNFNQPNANAMTLNRVIGNENSVIEGAINANGKVYLINSNGVLFTGTSKVNVGGLVASTLNITDDDFMHGNFIFQSDKDNPASVINQGEIIATDGGYVALMGGEIYNEGLIVASMGTVSLNSGKKVTLNFKGDSLLSATIDEAALESLVSNKGAIIADGGLVIMTAKAAGDILSAQVNNEGLVQARTISDLNGDYQKGEILLYAYDGTANIAGMLDASAPDSGKGGFIETSGDSVKIADDTVITTLATNGQTGTWLIDPTDFTIAANGGDMTGATLSNQLEKTNMVIESQKGTKSGQGDIYVNDKVEWDANTTLTLTAANDIFINNAIKATGLTAGLAMNFGGDYHILTKASFSGTMLDANGSPVAKEDTSGGIYGSISFTNTDNLNGLTINGDTYTLIHSMGDLANISGAYGNYALAHDLNANGTTYTAAVVGTLAQDSVFTGLGHIVDELAINSTSSGVGLFGTAAGNNIIRDIGVTNVNISTTGSMAGGLVANVTPINGNLNAIHNIIQNVYVSGNIYAGSGTAGGVVGRMYRTSVSNAFMSGSVSGGGDSGGLVGVIYQGGQIKNAHADITMDMIHPYAKWWSQSVDNIGGLLGLAYGDVEIYNTYAKGTIYAQDGASLGGLIGSLERSNLTNSYASVSITSKETGGSSGVKNVGGLVGKHDGGNINNVWAEGNVISTVATGKESYGGQSIGGLIGSSKNGTISDAYAYGNVSADGFSMYAGGFIGDNSSTISNGHAYGNVSAYTQSGGFVGWNSGSISNSTAAGDIIIRQTLGIYGTAGGFAGYNASGASLSNIHATGNVTGTVNAGGLVAINYGSITNSSSSGQVNGTGNVGGLVGNNSGTIDNSYWNTETSGQNNVTGNNIGSVSESQGLNNQQFNDVGYYIDGTIDQVLSYRAAQAADARHQAINGIYVLGNNSAYGAEELTQRAAKSNTVSNITTTQTGIKGLPGGSEKDFGYANASDSGKALTLADLSMRNFAATVKTISTDDGEIYDLEVSN